MFGQTRREAAEAELERERQAVERQERDARDEERRAEARRTQEAQAAEHAAKIQARIAEVLALTPEEHIQRAANWSAEPFSSDHVIKVQNAIQTELLWALVKRRSS
jgi:hypothetical protein